MNAELRIKTSRLIADDRENSGRSAAHLRRWEAEYRAALEMFSAGLSCIVAALDKFGL